jgi:hypothetical protein
MSTIKRNRKTLPDERSGLSKYGGVTIQFKKEKMKDKTTFCAGDSIRNGWGNSMCASKVTDPKIVSFLSVSNHFENYEEQIKDIYKVVSEVNKEKQPKLSSYLERWLDKKSSLLPFIRELMIENQNYWELQYHGRLSSDKIEKVYIDKRIVSQEWQNKLKNILDNRNIPYELV